MKNNLAGEAVTKKMSIRAFKGDYPLKRLYPYLKRYPLMVCATLLALMVAAFATLALPYATRLMIDHGFHSTQQGAIDRYFLYLLAIGAVLALASALRFYCVYWLSERLVADLKDDVFRKLTSLSAAFFDVHHSGELMSRFAADTTLISAAIRASISQALRNSVVLVGGIVMMVVSSSQLSLLVIVAIPLIVLPLVFYARLVRRLSRDAQTAQADLNKFGVDVFAHMQDVQAFNNQGLVEKRFSSSNESAVAKALSRTKARAFLTAIAIFLVLASIIAILWYGASGVIAGEISAGALVQFMLYAVFAGGAMGALSEVWSEVAQAAGATERLIEFLDTDQEVHEPVSPVTFNSPVEGKISFQSIGFAYPSRETETVLQDVSFDVAPGSRVAIVGASGAGKSTLFQLLLRFYDPLEGRILIDDVPINELTLNDLRREISFVPQDLSLFDMSIMENILFACPTASRTEVIDAAKAAQAHDFIEDFNDGYETIIGEKGASLSGGQRQRIALARAILKRAPILLLDEATNALDALAEEKVQNALDAVMNERTSLIIAHRLSTVQSADHILVMDQGRLVEQGNHESLLDRGGLYATLVKTQLRSDAA